MFKRAFAAFAITMAPTAAIAAENCPLPQIADTAELKPVAGSDLMTVPVEINGTPKQFLLDVGTGPMQVSQAAVTELSLPERAKMTTTIQVGGTGSMANMGSQQSLSIEAPVYETKGSNTREDLRPRVRIGTFMLGGATTKNMQLMIASDAAIAKDAPYDGRLTNDILRQYDLELDFQRHRITFLTSAKCTDPDQVVFWSHYEIGVIPITIVNGRIQVPVTIEGHPVQATIDTSSPRSVMRRDIAELTLGYKADAPGMMPSGDLKDGLGQTVYGHTFSQVAFAGGVTAVNVPALIQTNNLLRDRESGVVLGSHAISTADRLPDFTLGMDVLHQLHMYLVFGQKKLYVTANIQ